MKLQEWIDAGFDPPLGIVAEWIADQLGRIGGDESACYALSDRHGGRDVTRILVASDLGLLDCVWHRASRVEERQLTGTLIPWANVRSVRLIGETTLNPRTMKHRDPRWRMTLEEPRLTIEDAPADRAVLDFWRACRDSMNRAGTA